MKVSTKQQILSYLEGRQFVPSWELENMSSEWVSKASSVDRRCRELVNDGEIESKIIKGCVWYKKRPTIQSPYEHAKDKVTKEWADFRDNKLFETAPPRFTMDPLTKKAKDES